MATGDSVKVLEQYVVAPPPGTTTGEMTLPVSFLDIMWIFFSPVERLVFYELPISRSHFIDNYIPKLKHSLSSTLKDFLPLAGNLIIPSDSSNPEFRYTDGDGVSIIFAESCHNNFEYLTANYPRNCSELLPLVPRLPQPSPSNDTSRVVPLLALQVTLFPEAGICLGLTNHHGVGDASTIFGFMKAWAMNSKLGKDDEGSSLGDESRPSYDRSVIKDPQEVASLLWNQFRSLNLDSEAGDYLHPPADTNKIKQTFVLGKKDIQKLKNLVYTKRPTVKLLSSFTVTCAYLWTCLLKCDRSSKKQVDEEDLVSFAFPVDIRGGRVNPPVPINYFGNCLSFCLIEAKRDELLGEEGFPVAVEMIGESIHKRLQNKDEVLNDADTWFYIISNVDWTRTISVAGSPKYNYYHLDFGWGKAVKFECTSIDQTGAISLSGCRDSEGGLEIGLSYSREKMDAFASAFNEGLQLC